MEHVSSVALIFQAHASAEASGPPLFVKLIEDPRRSGLFWARFLSSLTPRNTRFTFMQLLQLLFDLSFSLLLLLHFLEQFALVLLKKLFALGQRLTLLLQ